MVASAHPYASQAGLDVLRDGGNAIDAAVAVASTLNVVEPYMSGAGGIGHALVYVANERRTRVLNFSGHAPTGAAPEVFTEESKQLGAKAPLVPGNAGGWLTMHEAYGRLPRQRVFRDAIEYASNGCPLTPFNAEMLKANWGLLTRFESTRKAFLGGASEPPGTGALFKQRALSASLAEIASEGAKSFYEGRLAAAMSDSFRAAGGLLTRDDLASYRPQWQEPLSTTYRGYEVRVPPPNSSGFQIPQTLNILNGYPRLEYGTVGTLHLIIEAIKLAVEDRVKYAGDPAFVDIPLPKLLSDGYAAELRAKIDPKRAGPQSKQRYPREHLAAGDGLPGERLFGPQAEARWWRSGLTTHFATADSEGNVVTVTQTLGNAYGSCMVAGDTGLFLNNMCLWFDIDPSVPSPNLIAPRKKVDFCVAPCQLFRDGEFALSIGTPGSYGILQTTLQMVHHYADAGMNVQEAIEAPRFRLHEPGVMNFEARFPAETTSALRALGHTPSVLPQGYARAVGGAHGIQRTEHGTFLGGADPRRDGVAMGW
jgi:gamma-glutamyltranspeptidase/glutathione hydrolase